MAARASAVVGVRVPARVLRQSDFLRTVDRERAVPLRERVLVSGRH